MNHEFSKILRLDHIKGNTHKDTITADPNACASLAKRFDLIEVKNFKADLTIHAKGGLRYHITGQVNADITQESALTAKPIEKSISHDIDAWYIDQSKVASFEAAIRERDTQGSAEEREIQSEADDPEKIYDGSIDLAEVAAQFFGLALDFFPRGDDEKEGSGDYIEVEAKDAKPNPFAKLAELKTDKK